ncbi:hypothetical protein [Ralstonia pseudosolanacearum]|uniref:hypothetical protein n=1 Tax=Ralstonia pseudosolanacearum TaxID=1310165 RepID=UPI0033948971
MKRVLLLKEALFHCPTPWAWASNSSALVGNAGRAPDRRVGRKALRRIGFGLRFAYFDFDYFE